MSNNESQSNSKKPDIDDAKEEKFGYEEEQQGNQTDNADEIASNKELTDENVSLPSAASAATIPLAAPAPAQSASARKGAVGWIALSAVLVVALIVVLIKPPFGGNASGGDIVATVNGTNITKDQLYEKLVTAGGTSTLDNMIVEELVNQEARAASIVISDQDVTDEIEAIKLQFGTDEAFNSTLQQYGLTLDALREDVRLQAMIRKVLEPKTDVTDEEVKQYFEDNKATLGGTPEQVRASHILVDTQEEADAILADLKGGADFAETAQAKSKDGSAASGGDLGYFGRGQMVPEFEEAAFALEVGATSEVVKSDFGFHIINKTDYKPATELSFEDKQAAIRTLLVGQEANGLSAAWIEEIRTKATITNTLEENADEPTETETGSQP